ncbi:hypothetical protein Aph02nite_26680 [Actinoplanes philippinensis]|uniref:Uncharacterized protein n=1 Tax=Actinoplanes philippinensis TaxID=35752 RepID=A0A1I2G9K7_9ACTN|nr:hypothetical protein [Actinoplanes philippinensis]GIE76718.1 hypothetical protein Aph02nite_26680 [Actinoplanes philippinensis]SFF13839.1 hypothetical protein SAMN05421541_106324 [Actinoplanes philippinensis]
MKTASTGAAGCLSLVAFCLSPVAGSTLAMPATALYVSRHYPAELDKSDHWLLFACLSLPLAGLIAWWTARRRERVALTVTVRAVTLLVAAFAVTMWTLEHYAVPVELLSFVPILTGWAAILLLLVLLPLLNRMFPAPLRPSAAGAPVSYRRPSPGSRSSSGHRPGSRSRSASRSASGSGGGQQRGPRHTDSPRRSQDGQPQYRSRDGQPQYRSRDGQPDHRKARPTPPRSDGTPRYRSAPTDRPGHQAARPRQGDGRPQYRAEPPAPPPRRPSGDGKPVYRDD